MVIVFYQSIETFNQVVHQQLRGLHAASARIAEMELDATESDEYEEAMRDYAISAVFCINTVNEIGEDIFFYKKYEMPNFDYFVHEEVCGSEENIAKREECIKVITEIAKELDSISNLDIYYNFAIDSKNIHKRIKNIEQICEAWE